MSQIILNNCLCLVAGYDMSGKLNAIALDDTPDELDNTTFGCTAKSRKQGLSLVIATLAGFWEAAPDLYYSDFTLTNVPMTIAPEPTIGGPAYSFLSRNTEYQFGGTVGEMGKFSMKAQSVGQQLIRGAILENGVTARIATGQGAAFELGTVGAAQYMHGCIHVISAATAVGDTLNVIIESDSAETFDVSPETQLTFTQILGNGGAVYEWLIPVIGPVTDTWWRCSWTIAEADAASFNFAVFFGIL
jgi:hypothetical protein